MEKLKQIIWERIGHASVCWDEKGVFDEVEANKAANAIWDAVQPLLQADEIVRKLAKIPELEPIEIADALQQAQSYTALNPK